MRTAVEHGAAEIELAGERLWLLPDRAAWWPAQATLIVSDLHLGKSQALRTLGIPMPGGTNEEQLGRLSRLIESAGATRVVVVGDLLHAPAGITAELTERVAAWRRMLAAELVLVTGNHDRAVAGVAPVWGLALAGEELASGGLRFVHAPRPDHPPGTVCGHVHPAIVVRGGGDAVKLPCFHVSGDRLTLPAFSLFTGGVPIRPGIGDRVFGVCPGVVSEVRPGSSMRAGPPRRRPRP